MKTLPHVLLTFCLITMSALADAVDSGDVHPVSNERNRWILHYDTIRFLPKAGSIEAELSAALEDSESSSQSFELAFDALGQRFELVLESNERLIQNLPESQKNKLRESYKILRGRLVGVPDSWVRLTQTGHKWSGVIYDGNGEVYVVEPSENVAASLFRQSAQSLDSRPVIYRLSDTETKEPEICGVEGSARALKSANDYSTLVEELQANFPEAADASAPLQLDVAIVADKEFVSLYSNDPEGTVINRMNVVDGIYAEQVGVHLNVIEIRALQNNGTLTSIYADTLLYAFSDYVAAPGFNNPGLAHLFTGKNLYSSTVGIAYLGVLCNKRYGIGLSQVGSTGTLGALIVAHELGHNFGAPHDNQYGSPCATTPNSYIMNPWSNGSETFSDCSLNQMQPQIDVAACIVAAPDNSEADLHPVLPHNPINAMLGVPFNQVIEVHNQGSATAVNSSVIIRDVPLDILDADAPGSCIIGNDNSVDCSTGNISAGATRQVQLTLQSHTSGSFISNISVASSNDSNPGNNHIEAQINVEEATSFTVFTARFENNSTDGFVYHDNTFSDGDRAMARGKFAASGYTGRAVRVILGGRNNQTREDMSGGWRRTFSLASPKEVTLAFVFKLIQKKDYDPDEFSEALLSVDGKLVGLSGNDYLARLTGNGNGGPNLKTPWVHVTLKLGLMSTGQHTITLGAYNNKKDTVSEMTTLKIDDVIVEAR